MFAPRLWEYQNAIDIDHNTVQTFQDIRHDPRKKSHRVYSYSQSGVRNADSFLDFSSKGICEYPLFRSITENQRKLSILLNKSVMCGRGNESTITDWLNLRQSIRNRKNLSSFSTRLTPEAYGDLNIMITLADTIVCTYFWTL